MFFLLSLYWFVSQFIQKPATSPRVSHARIIVAIPTVCTSPDRTVGARTNGQAVRVLRRVLPLAP